ncbi:MAG: GFA family protein [Gaiellaceae bacterium]
MISGSCLCGGVRFEIARAVGPFELCHCRRCRKASGAAFVAGLGVRTADFRLLQGRELIATYDAPILESPPPYRTSFCSRCGSPVPNPTPNAEWFEIPAGLLDDDPQIRPDKHIFVELKAPWVEITDGLPQHDKPALLALRTSQRGVRRP